MLRKAIVGPPGLELGVTAGYVTAFVSHSADAFEGLDVFVVADMVIGH